MGHSICPICLQDDPISGVSYPGSPEPSLENIAGNSYEGSLGAESEDGKPGVSIHAGSYVRLVHLTLW